MACTHANGSGATAISGPIAWRRVLPLDVGELLRHPAVAQHEQVDAPDVAGAPVVPPLLHDAVAGAPEVLDLEPAAWVVEDRRPRRGHRVPTDVALAVGRRPRALEDTVVGDQRQRAVEIVAVPGVVERIDDGDG